MNFTKIDQADLDSPRQELSNGGLKSVVALLICWGINFQSARIGRPIQLYCSTRPDAVVRFMASEMILALHLNASYLSEPGAKVGQEATFISKTRQIGKATMEPF